MEPGDTVSTISDGRTGRVITAADWTVNDGFEPDLQAWVEFPAQGGGFERAWLPQADLTIQ